MSELSTKEMQSKDYYKEFKKITYDPIDIEKNREYFGAFINTYIAGLIRDGALTRLSNPTDYNEIDAELCQIYNERKGTNLTKEEFSPKRQSKEIPTYASWSFHFGADGYFDQAYVIYGFKISKF